MYVEVILWNCASSSLLCSKPLSGFRTHSENVKVHAMVFRPLKWIPALPPTSSPPTHFWLLPLKCVGDSSALVFAPVLLSAENTVRPALFQIHSLGSLLPDRLRVHTRTHTPHPPYSVFLYRAPPTPPLRRITYRPQSVIHILET